MPFFDGILAPIIRARYIGRRRRIVGVVELQRDLGEVECLFHNQRERIFRKYMRFQSDDLELGTIALHRGYLLPGS
jgi:hypothetical protein